MRVIYRNVRRDILHFVPLCHVHLSPSWCQNLWCKCYMLLTAVTYQNMRICYFCCIWSVHLMSRSSTCVLMYDMQSLERCKPCIFVIYVVTSTSMQTRLRDVSVFRDFGFCCLLLLLFWCHVSMCLQRDPCSFWLCSVRMFSIYSCALSIHAPVCNYGVP